MILNYSSTYVVDTLGTLFAFAANESEPPAPPVVFGPGVDSNITIEASATRKGVSGSNAKSPIGGSR